MIYKPSKSEWYRFDLSRSFKVKSDGAFGHLIYNFLLMFNSKLWPISGPLRHISLQNLSDLGRGLSRSSNVKCDGNKAIPIYDFLLVFNSTTWPNTALLRDISLEKLSGIEIVFSMSVKSNVIISLDSHIWSPITVTKTCATTSHIIRKP